MLRVCKAEAQDKRRSPIASKLKLRGSVRGGTGSARSYRKWGRDERKRGGRLRLVL